MEDGIFEFGGTLERAHFAEKQGQTWDRATRLLEALCNTRCPDRFNIELWFKYHNCWKAAIETDTDGFFDRNLLARCADESRCPGMHLKEVV